VYLVLQTVLLLLQKMHLLLQGMRLLLQTFRHKKRSRSAYKFSNFFCKRKCTLLHQCFTYPLFVIDNAHIVLIISAYIFPPSSSGFKVTLSGEIRFIFNFSRILLSKILLNLVIPGTSS